MSFDDSFGKYDWKREIQKSLHSSNVFKDDDFELWKMKRSEKEHMEKEKLERKQLIDSELNDRETDLRMREFSSVKKQSSMDEREIRIRQKEVELENQKRVLENEMKIKEDSFKHQLSMMKEKCDHQLSIMEQSKSLILNQNLEMKKRIESVEEQMVEERKNHLDMVKRVKQMEAALDVSIQSEEKWKRKLESEIKENKMLREDLNRNIRIKELETRRKEEDKERESLRLIQNFSKLLEKKDEKILEPEPKVPKKEEKNEMEISFPKKIEKKTTEREKYGPRSPIPNRPYSGVAKETKLDQIQREIMEMKNEVVSLKTEQKQSANTFKELFSRQSLDNESVINTIHGDLLEMQKQQNMFKKEVFKPPQQTEYNNNRYSRNIHFERKTPKKPIFTKFNQDVEASRELSKRILRRSKIFPNLDDENERRVFNSKYSLNEPWVEKPNFGVSSIPRTTPKPWENQSNRSVYDRKSYRSKRDTTIPKKNKYEGLNYRGKKRKGSLNEKKSKSPLTEPIKKEENISMKATEYDVPDESPAGWVNNENEDEEETFPEPSDQIKIEDTKKEQVLKKKEEKEVKRKPKPIKDDQSEPDLSVSDTENFSLGKKSLERAMGKKKIGEEKKKHRYSKVVKPKSKRKKENIIERNRMAIINAAASKKPKKPIVKRNKPVLIEDRVAPLIKRGPSCHVPGLVISPKAQAVKKKKKITLKGRVLPMNVISEEDEEEKKVVLGNIDDDFDYSASGKLSAKMINPRKSVFRKARLKKKTLDIMKEECDERGGVKYPSFLKMKVFPPSYIPRTQNPEPPKMELEYVYGMNSKNACSDLLFLNHQNKILFHGAATGVIFDPATNTQSFGVFHDDDIKCMDIHPDRRLVVTGECGKDDKIKVWDSETGKVLHVFESDKYFVNGGVISVAWSCDGNKIFAVGGLELDSVLLIIEFQRYKDVNTSKWVEEYVHLADFNCSKSRTLGLKGHPTDPECCYWIGTDGLKIFRLINNSVIKSKKGTVYAAGGRTQAYYTVSFGVNYTYCATERGYIYVFFGGKMVYKKKAHKGSCNSVITVQGGVISGGNDGKMVIWTAYNGKSMKELNSYNFGMPLTKLCLDGTGSGVFFYSSNGVFGYYNFRKNRIKRLTNFHGSQKVDNELWGLGLVPNTPYFITASDDGKVIIFDKDKRKSICEIRTKMKWRGVAIDERGRFVACSSANGKVWIYKLASIVNKNPNPILKISTQSNKDIMVIKFSPNGKFLAVASHDTNIYLYSVNEKFNLYKVLKGHSSYINNLDFSVDSRWMQTSSGDYELLYWDVSQKNRILYSYEMRDINWDSQTALFGWSVRGMWSGEVNDGTDINTCCVHKKSDTNGILLSGDDFGMVNCFRYPTLVNAPKHNRYPAHASHVTCVRITKDGKHAISTGGGDQCVMQWKILE